MAREVLQHGVQLMATIAAHNLRLLALSAGNGESDITTWLDEQQQTISTASEDLRRLLANTANETSSEELQVLADEMSTMLACYDYLQDKVVISRTKMSPVLIHTIVKTLH